MLATLARPTPMLMPLLLFLAFPAHPRPAVVGVAGGRVAV